jgi:hypothetical protein
MPNGFGEKPVLRRPRHGHRRHHPGLVAHFRAAGAVY